MAQSQYTLSSSTQTAAQCKAATVSNASGTKEVVLKTQTSRLPPPRNGNHEQQLLRGPPVPYEPQKVDEDYIKKENRAYIRCFPQTDQIYLYVLQIQ